VRFSRSLAAALAVVSLAGCGLLKSPADGLTFHAPDGWRGTPGFLGRVQTWTHVSGSGVSMLILTSVPGLTAHRVAGRPASGTTIEQREMVLCGSQSSFFRKSNITSHDRHFISETVVTSAPGSGYVAIYMYPAGSAPDAQAEAAIYELCPSLK
jgi:hypothetical protein